MKFRPLRVALALALAGGTPSAVIAAPAAPGWTVDKAHSAIGFSGVHAGNAFNGQFNVWSARIAFDPKNLPASRIVVAIDTRSAVTGDKVQETSLTGEEWLDSTSQPHAIFTSQSVKANGGNRYTAQGALTLKGVKFPVELPFTLNISGASAQANGRLVLDRARMNIGMKSDPEAEWVSKEIVVTISVNAARAR